MDLPTIKEPQRYCGLYVYDFGQWTAVGYTADEIAVLLESETYGGGQVYKIQRATPDGRMELRGIARERFQVESGTFFYRAELTGAQADFEQLRSAAGNVPPPGRAMLHLTDRGPAAGGARFATVLIYPAEYEDELGRWLLAIEFQGGDLVEGGSSHVADYYAEQNTILQRQQLWSATTRASRSAEEVLASVRRAIQR